MKLLLVGGALAAVVGVAWYSRAEPNVYSMNVAEAYAKLREAQGPKRDDGTAKFLQNGGNGSTSVNWMVGGSSCQADLAPDEKGTRVTAYCSGGGEGAATGMYAGMMRGEIIEHIDSTLRGREFDKRKASVGETASLWPKDVRQPDGSIGAAAGEALKMDREMKKSMADFDEQMKQVEQRAQSEVARHPSSATRPMTDLNR